ncbi:MAG: hypothetical protein J1F39_02820 [Clostridiales bacterium]|nr:hypothetical protein [Clostridiales bacterium]
MNDYEKWESRRKLEDEILALEEESAAKKGNTTIPETKLSEKTYDAPSDDELKSSAESSLEDYKKNGIDSINESSANSEKELNNKRDTVENNMNGALSALEGDYAAAAERIDNDVIRRGLARSSIAVTGKADLERDYLTRADNIRSGYTKQLDDLDTEISAIGTKLKQALDDFNLSYAAKLNEKLASLKAERAKKQEEVLEYNNEIRAKQAELDRKRIETESKINGDKSLTKDEQDLLDKAVYAKFDAYLATMNKTDARLEIRNHSLYQKHLSPLYYYMLFDKYGR